MDLYRNGPGGDQATGTQALILKEQPNKIVLQFYHEGRDVNNKEKEAARAKVHRIVEEVMKRPQLERMLTILMKNHSNAGSPKDLAMVGAHSVIEASSAAATVAAFMAMGYDPEDFKATPEEMEQRKRDLETHIGEHSTGKFKVGYVRRDEG